MVWKKNSNLVFDIKRKSGFSNNINYTYTGYRKTNSIFFKRNAIKVDREKRDTPSLTIFFPQLQKCTCQLQPHLFCFNENIHFFSVGIKRKIFTSTSEREIKSMIYEV